MTTHADGIYWVKWSDGKDEPFLMEKRGRDWSTFGSEDDYDDASPSIEEKLVVLAGPLRAPNGTQASLSWNGGELTAELTCGECGHTEMHSLYMGDPVECKACRRLWRPTLVIGCELVTDEAAIAKFRRDYYGEGR